MCQEQVVGGEQGGGEIPDPGRVPAFEEVETEVKAEWIADQRAETRRRAYEAMRARYEIVLPGPAKQDASAAGAPSVKKVP